MTKRRGLALALALAIGTSGCTLAGAVVGGAAGAHAERGSTSKDGSTMVTGALTGGGVGLIVDVLLVAMVVSAVDDIEPPRFEIHPGGY